MTKKGYKTNSSTHPLLCRTNLKVNLRAEWFWYIQDLNSGYEVDLLLFQSLLSCHIHLKPETGPMFMQQ